MCLQRYNNNKNKHYHTSDAEISILLHIVIADVRKNCLARIEAIRTHIIGFSLITSHVIISEQLDRKKIQPII
jgi:hypothetical protein